MRTLNKRNGHHLLRYANIYIDDAALGTPLRYAKEGGLYRPYVDWDKMRILLRNKGVL